MNGLHQGLSHRASAEIIDLLTVPGIAGRFKTFEGMPPIFATAMMVGMVESTCVDCIAPFLEGGFLTLGTHVNLSHVAPTPVGFFVTANVTLIEMERRRLVFAVEVWDDNDTISLGTHERTLVEATRFLTRVQEKRQTSALDGKNV